MHNPQGYRKGQAEDRGRAAATPLRVPVSARARAPFRVRVVAGTAPGEGWGKPPAPGKEVQKDQAVQKGAKSNLDEGGHLEKSHGGDGIGDGPRGTYSVAHRGEATRDGKLPAPRSSPPA